MKKIIFTLLALVGTMSMNAQKVQVMKIMKNGEVIAKYKAAEADEVVFVEELETTGTAEATIGGVKTNVNWVQLWKDGPKFAEYNVGATSATEYGGYYNWGKTTNKDTSDAYKDGTDALTGNDDTATALWGSNWRMPTSAELCKEAGGLLYECDCVWTTQNGVNGLLCTGKGDYKDNSVFLPAAGNFCNGNVGGQSYYGSYWSSTPNSSNNAYYLHYASYSKSVGDDSRTNGFSVRAVLKETLATTGVAKATIGGVETDVNWVQLWTGGPKFAEYNVDGEMTFTDAIKTGSDYVWGTNWCTPSKDEMNELLKAATSGGSTKVTCEYTQENSVWGFKFTGLTDGYTSNSVFFPAQGGDSDLGDACYWSPTADGCEVWDMFLIYYYGKLDGDWLSDRQDYKSLVRPVLK